MTLTMARCATVLAVGTVVLASACTDPAPEVVEVSAPAKTTAVSSPVPGEATDDAEGSP